MNGYPGNYGFNYIQLIRKADNKEVYSSPSYMQENSCNYDTLKIKKTLDFYFNRINMGIQLQLESPKLTAEQKSELKFISKDDYLVREAVCLPVGYCFTKINWVEEASEYLK